MSCLLPQFKCQPDPFSICFRTHPRHAKTREPICFKAKCLLSTASSPTSTSTAVLNLENLRLPSLEPHSNSVTTKRPSAYIEPVALPNEATFGLSLPTETLFTIDEAVIGAAGAQSATLVRASAKAVKHARHSVKTKNSCAVSSISNTTFSMWSHLTETERADILGDPVAAEAGSELTEEFGIQYPIKESNYLEPTAEELSLLEKQFSNSIAACSTRQMERKARRARAAEKAAVNVVPVKSCYTSKKKHGSLQSVDFSDPLHYLRKATRTSRVLSAAEEFSLSEGIQDLLKLERLQEDFAQRFGDQPTFAQWAAAAGISLRTLRKRLNYGIFCKDEMVKCNIKLVITIAKNYQGSGINIQDLIQEGCRGLVRATQKFDASKGFRFSTYAHWWIKQAIRKSLPVHSNMIHLPFHLVEATYKVRKARKQFYRKNGRYPDDEEIAAATGLSMKKLHDVQLAPKAPKSFDRMIGHNNYIKLSDTIADPEAETADDLLMKQFRKQELEKVLNSLSPKENQVIRMRYGMLNGRMISPKEIGEIMGVSSERVRQIESSAFRKLKNKKRIEQLKEYMNS